VAAQAATEVVTVERPTKLRESRERDSDASPTDCHVLLLCRVLDKHRGTSYERTLGSVKAEKISHIVESHLNIDLGRTPVQDAAGPVDYPHLRGNVFHRAKRRYAFEARHREGGIGHYFVPLNGLGKALRQSTEVFGEKAAEIDRIIELFLPMDSNQAEIVATLYAAWNDLLATGIEPTEEHIFSEFYVWDEQKQRFDRSRLENALAWMREHGLVPTGTGKLTVREG
jgi:type I restriction enzyme S subunit